MKNIEQLWKDPVDSTVDRSGWSQSVQSVGSVDSFRQVWAPRVKRPWWTGGKSTPSWRTHRRQARQGDFDRGWDLAFAWCDVFAFMRFCRSRARFGMLQHYILQFFTKHVAYVAVKTKHIWHIFDLIYKTFIRFLGMQHFPHRYFRFFSPLSCSTWN